jgi:phage/plasmid-associated DNA primase
MTRQIIGPSDPNLEPQLHKELEGVLVKAVMGLREAMDAGSYDNPEVCKRALEDYEYSCNSSALFINEKLEFSDSHKLPISKSRLMDSYSAFCRERRLERGTRNEFYKMLEELGGEQLQSHWLSKGTGESDRGYLGVAFKLTLYSGF